MKWLIIISSALLAAGLGASLWSGQRVGDAARRIAGASPYCLQIPTGLRDPAYRPIKSKTDLAGHNLWAPRGDIFPHYAFHAVLIVETGRATEIFNWSYRAGRFVPVGANARERLHYPLRKACTPREDYLDSL